MASKRKKTRKKKNKSKFILFKHKLLDAGRLVCRKGGQILSGLAGTLRTGWQKLRKLPPVLRILGIYLLTVLLAGSIFYWRMNQLRVTDPDMAEPSFDWEAPLPRVEIVEAQGSAEADESTVTAEPEPDSEPEREAEPVQAQPVFEKGVWPVRGDLVYGFNQTSFDPTPGGYLGYTTKGLGIKAEPGTEVVAAWDGEVEKVVKLDKPYGSSVTIRHDNGFITYYGALATVTVEPGDKIEQGRCIGTAGPGYEGEPDYLYLEMKKDGRVVDPVEYLAR